MIGTIDVANEIIRELERARSKHPIPFHSFHEGYAILAEEVYELWREVIRQERSGAAIRKEAVQVGAMALRFILDLYGE